jgi:predicted chitinase
MPINLNNAAKYYKEMPHQIAAWNFLESKIPEEILDEFAEIYRAAPSEPKVEIITPEIMHALTGYAANKFDATFCGDFNKLLLATGFDKHLDAVAMLTANLMHETANFVYMEEIADGWAYEDRLDLGNIYPGDGPKYKGAGVLMLTGRYNYSRAAAELNDPLVLSRGCEYVAKHYPFRSAQKWIRDNDLLGICLNKGFDDCCYRINGCWNGYDDRLAKYKICKKVFKV